jgi:hypothetical protein
MSTDASGEAGRTGARLAFAIAAAAYLGIALWCYRSVLPDPSSLLPIANARFGKHESVRDLYRSDRRFVVAVVTEGARRILRGDFDLHEQTSCFPLSRAATLGEHMIGESLLGVVPYALTGEPIFTFNAVDVLFLWIAALGMYALAYFWTGHAGGAFVAGLLFAFHPSRLTNPAHPFGYGNLWTPLVLLAAHRLVVRGRWRDAFLLALFLSLQLLESLYPILALAILGGTYGVYLLIRFRASVLHLLPKLAFVAIVTGGVAVWLFAPYLETRAVWGLLQGRRTPVMVALHAYLPGGTASFGLLGLILAVIALVDRARRARPRDGYDPRWVLTVGALLVAWSTIGRTRIGSFEITHTSPLLWAGHWIPGVDALRVLSALRFGVFLVVAFLSAYGVQVLTERLRGTLRIAAVSLLIAVAAVEVLHPRVAKALYYWDPALVAEQERPSDETIRLFAGAPDGAVIELPAGGTGAYLSRRSRAIFLAAYHGRPVASCYNSFETPLGAEIARLGNALPGGAAADALYALGFRIVVVHRRVVSPSYNLAALLKGSARLIPLGGNADFEVLALASPTPTLSDPTVLAPGGPVALGAVAGTKVELPFAILNPTASTFVHPRPIEPQPLVVEWRDGSGRSVSRETVRALLPVALGAGDHVTRTIAVTAPTATGRYQVVASLPARGDAPLATIVVKVVPAAAEPPPDHRSDSSAGSDQLFARRSSGRSTQRARRNSPRPFACGSERVDAATPSPSRPTTTKFSASRFGKS